MIENNILLDERMINLALNENHIEKFVLFSNKQNNYYDGFSMDKKGEFYPFVYIGNGKRLILSNQYRCPYGQIGDLLWVRENWSPVISRNCILNVHDYKKIHIEYQAGGGEYYPNSKDIPENWTFDESSHSEYLSASDMPYWASRITLEIISIKLIRLKDIMTIKEAFYRGLINNETLCLIKEKYKSCDLNNLSEFWKVVIENINPFVWHVKFQRVR
ncbi:hypothetical protein [Xenorhabdus sp. KJ12.1]|uniref:hypothetical protein n=1 Tax=Xenorhabdus sp. KJ12.1 TaxID=1851571 RepID=UPI000C04914F|nr:hypothetical protein [Xenorhabdus sp. KJ12.1]PHM72326.1 hypothetical protein Xekj_00604 [Xenorhabdus sp. KJ12.1]